MSDLTFQTIGSRWNSMGQFYSGLGQAKDIGGDIKRQVGAAVKGLFKDGLNGAARACEQKKMERDGLFYTLLLPRTAYDFVLAIFDFIATQLARLVSDYPNTDKDPTVRDWLQASQNHYSNIGALWKYAESKAEAY